MWLNINQTQKDVLMNCKFVISTCEKQKSERDETNLVQQVISYQDQMQEKRSEKIGAIYLLSYILQFQIASDDHEAIRALQLHTFKLTKGDNLSIFMHPSILDANHGTSRARHNFIRGTKISQDKLGLFNFRPILDCSKPRLIFLQVYLT